MRVPFIQSRLPFFVEDKFPLETSFKEDTFKFVANSSDTVKIDVRNGVIDTFELRIRATVTVAGTPPTVPAYAGIANLIKSIVVKANNKDTFIDISPMMTTVLSIGDTLQPQHTDDVLGTATKTYDAYLRIDGRQLRTYMPWISGFDLRVLNRLEMKLNFGDINDLYGSPESAVLSDVTIDLNRKGTLASRMAPDMYMRELIQVSNEIDRDKKDFEAVLIDQENVVSGNDRDVAFVRGIYLVGAHKNILKDVFDDTENVRVKIGNTSSRDIEIGSIRRDNRIEFNGRLPHEVLYIPMYGMGELRDSPPKTNLNGGLKVELGALNVVNNECEIIALADVVRHFKV